MSDLAFLCLGYALEHLLLSGAVALVVFALCRRKAIGAATKSGIVLAALVLCVLGPALPLSPGANAGAADAAVAGYAGNAAGPAGPQVTTRMPAAAGEIAIDPPIAQLLVAFWFAGIAWQLGQRAQGFASLRRVVATSKRSLALEHDYRELVPDGVEIRLTDSFGPAVAGAVRPTIFVPKRLAATLPEAALRAVLLHEASHIRRRDVAAHALQKTVEALFWWNPAIRWMGTTLDALREIACDVEASRSCATPADYADALLTAIEHIAPSRNVRFVSALGAANASQILDLRIDGIIDARDVSGPTARIALIGALLAMASACVAAEAISRPLLPVPASVPRDASILPDVSHPASVEIAVDSATRNEEAEDATQRASDDYERAASNADRDYTEATNAAGATYRRQVAALERMPMAQFDERLERIRVDYETAASAARTNYENAIVHAAKQFEAAEKPGARYRTGPATTTVAGAPSAPAGTANPDTRQP